MVAGDEEESRLRSFLSCGGVERFLGDFLGVGPNSAGSLLKFEENNVMRRRRKLPAVITVAEIRQQKFEKVVC